MNSECDRYMLSFTNCSVTLHVSEDQSSVDIKAVADVKSSPTNLVNEISEIPTKDSDTIIKEMQERINKLEHMNMENRYNHHVYPSQYLSDEFTVFRYLNGCIHNSYPTSYQDLLVSNYGRICWQHLESGWVHDIRFNIKVANYSQLAFLNKKLNLEQLKKLRDYEATVDSLIYNSQPNISGLVKFLSEL